MPYEVFGEPDHRLPANYRGVERDVIGDLAEPDLRGADRALATAAWERRAATGYIVDLDIARGLFESASRRHGAPTDLVELTQDGQPTSTPSRLLGYDVTYAGGGYDSLIAGLVLRGGRPADRAMPSSMAAEAARVRASFAPFLNGNCLFGDIDEADRFLADATREFLWEGPDITWAPVGLWLVASVGRPATG